MDKKNNKQNKLGHSQNQKGVSDNLVKSSFELSEMSTKISNLGSEVLKFAQQWVSDAVEDAKQQVKNECDAKVEKLNTELEKAKQEKDEAQNKVEEIKKEKKEAVEQAKEDIKKQFERKLEDLEKDKRKLEQNIKDEKNRHNDEIEVLKNKHAKELETQKADIEAKYTRFSNNLAFADNAKEYSAKVLKLVAIGEEIKSKVAKLASMSLDDPYNIYKTISKCWIALSKIDTNSLIVEAETASSNACFVIKGKSGLDTATTSDNVETYYSKRLAEYINAVYTLNENCIGMDRLLDGVSSKDVAPFVEFRKKLDNCCEELRMTVESVHLFDNAGVNSKLKSTLVNAGMATGQILEISNCLVYKTGTNPPSDKIEVKVQS